MNAYVELSYRRREDAVPVTLLATLPTVRPIRVGGSPSELRLPGVDPEHAYATITWMIDHFHFEPLDGAPPIRINGAAIDDSGARLQPGDQIALLDYSLTFQTGDPPADRPMAETPLRWMVCGPVPEPDELPVPDDPSAPHIREFELSVRPLIHGRRFDEVQRLAESEIKRLLRLDESEALEGYARHLWWTRVRCAREADDASSAEIAREAIDLFPDFSPLMVACGVTFLTARDWRAALEAFDRGIEHGDREFLMSLHDARLGRSLALIMQEQEAERPRSADAAGDPAVVKVHCPGDDVLLWRMAYYGRVFGPIDRVRFVFRGQTGSANERGPAGRCWDIYDMGRGLISRHVIVEPPLPMADPTLLLEVQALRSAIEQGDRSFGQALADFSHRPVREQEPPVVFDETALKALPRSAEKPDGCVRVIERRGGIVLRLDPAPQDDDVVYQQGKVSVAISEADARKLAGSRLTHSGGSRGRFVLELQQGLRLGVKIERRPTALLERLQGLERRPAIVAVALLAVGALAVLVIKLLSAAR